MLEIIITYPQDHPSMKNWRKQVPDIPRAPKNIEEIQSHMENRELINRFKINDDFFVHEIPKTSDNNTGTTIALLTESFVKELSTQRKVNGYLIPK